MEPSIVLIHSPFLGPASWQAVAHVLIREGRRVRVPNLSVVATSRPPYWPAGLESIVVAAGGDPIVLVPHSNAGLFVPAVVDALGDRVRGVVFVDAALPGTGHRSTPDFLHSLPTVDGLLPPWTSWWDDADVAALFPNADVRAAVEAEQPRMPLAYFEHLPPAPEGWAEPPCGYAWFGPPYDQGAERAAARGWPTVHVPGRHLHMLVDPHAVAAAVLRLAGDWR